MKLRKIIALLTLVGCVIAPVSSFAKALPGEVEKIVPYVLYGEQTGGNLRLVLPEKYKDYEPEPYQSRNEDNYSQWNIFKRVTLDGVQYRWVKMDNASGVWFEYVLIPDVNPYTQNELPETEQVQAAVKASFNKYYQFGKNASDMRIFTKDKVRSFKSAYYPKLQLEGLTDRGRGEGFNKIPMVGIREFVESTDNLSLVWSSGTARVTNSTNGRVTDFCIYNKGGTKKATLINNTSYASLTDLLIAEYGEEEFAKFKYYFSNDYGQDIAYFSFDETANIPSERMKIVKNALSNFGILNVYAQAATWTNYILFKHNANASSGGMGNAVSTGLTPIEELEQLIVPSGCIYRNPYVKFSNQYNDIEAWKTKMREAVKDKKTDKEKVQTLVKLLAASSELSERIKYGTGAPSGIDRVWQAAVEKALAEGKYFGKGYDVQNLFLMACTENNIPSVKLSSTAYETGEEYVPCDYMVAAYYDGKWNYFNIENAEEIPRNRIVASKKTGEENNMSYYITVSKYAGLSNSEYLNPIASEEELEYARVWSERYSAAGYR